MTVGSRTKTSPARTAGRSEPGRRPRGDAQRRPDGRFRRTCAVSSRPTLPRSLSRAPARTSWARGKWRFSIPDPTTTTIWRVSSARFRANGSPISSSRTHASGPQRARAARLASAVGAPIVSGRAHVARPSAPAGLDAAHDASYAPDTVLADGEAVRFSALALTAVATSRPLGQSFGFRAGSGEDALFSGDHVMAWSTTVVAPPDGSMSDYMASLEKLRGRVRREIYWPRPRRRPVREPEPVPARVAEPSLAPARGWRFSRASRPGRRRIPEDRPASLCRPRYPARRRRRALHARPSRGT